jgi:dTMP kinase
MFITFEGLDGSGKTTQAHMLERYILSKDQPVTLTREIGGTPAGEKIREIVLNNRLLRLSEVLLIIAARIEHVHKLIIPALENKHWVICDRFLDSTAAYQGEKPGYQYPRETPFIHTYGLHNQLVVWPIIYKPFIPDLTFFIDTPPQIALQRTIGRNGNNKFEDMDLLFHEGVYEAFLDIAKQFPERIVRIDGTKSIEEVHKEITSHIKIPQTTNDNKPKGK